MSLSSLHLDAFMAAARLKSMSQAAKAMHITQSALSQRILNLEAELGVNVFIRNANGLRLTPEGEKLLLFAANREALESEFVQSLRNDHQAFVGQVRIAAFATFHRSRLLPKLASIKRQHPGIQLDVLVADVSELVKLLRAAEAHFVFTTIPVAADDMETHCVGFERNVLIEGEGSADVFLDHNERDTTTFDFWKIQQNPPQIKRAYFAEIYTIIDAVAEGFGRAVVPLHLIENDSRVRVVSRLRPLDVPIYLVYFKHSHRTGFHQFLLTEFMQAW